MTWSKLSKNNVPYNCVLSIGCIVLLVLVLVLVQNDEKFSSNNINLTAQYKKFVNYKLTEFESKLEYTTEKDGNFKPNEKDPREAYIH